MKIKIENNWPVRLAALIQREIVRFVRVVYQTIIPPLISAFLYLLIFGVFIGEKVGPVNGHSYLAFLIPGLILMDVINGSYQNSVATLFIAKWLKHIHEVLVSPVSYFEMTVAYLIGGIVRAFILAISIYALAGFFGGFTIQHPLWACYWIVMVSAFFASLGLAIALWAKDWEQLEFLPSFILTPMSFLGGVFYSIHMLPPVMQTITRLNPLFYCFDFFRWSMIGYSEGNLLYSFVIVTGLSVAAVCGITYLFKSGYQLRS